MKRFPLLPVFVILLFILGVGSLRGDTVYLKNGRVVDGIIKAEDEQKVRMEFEYGTIEFRKSDIERIQRSTPDQADLIRAKWSRQKAGEAKTDEEERPSEVAQKPKGPLKVEHFVVTALLNNKVKVQLLLDTGATFIILSKQVGQKLGIDSLGDNQLVQIQVGDGRRVQAAYLSLKSVKVDKAEAADVAAAVLLDDSESLASLDGMLGMSFLNRFNFKLDHQKKKLTFEKF